MGTAYSHFCRLLAVYFSLQSVNVIRQEQYTLFTK